MMEVPLSRRSLIAMIGLAILPGRTMAATIGPVFVTVKTADRRTSRVTYWRARRRRGTILFSHGALSSPAKYAALIGPWVEAGFDVWAPLHVDSTDHPDTARFPALMSWAARIEDMRALAAHVGARRYVAAGHSYGGLVALTLGGAAPLRPEGVAGPLADPHVSSVVAFSPPGPMAPLIAATGYATVSRPTLIVTGTKDAPPGGNDPNGWQSHLAAYDAPPPSDDRYALVLDGVDHYFGGMIGRPELPGPRQATQFARAARLSTAFLLGYGVGDSRSRAALAQAVDGIKLRRR